MLIEEIISLFLFLKVYNKIKIEVNNVCSTPKNGIKQKINIEIHEYLFPMKK